MRSKPEMLPGVWYTTNNFGAEMIEQTLGVKFQQTPLRIDYRSINYWDLLVNGLRHPQKINDLMRIKRPGSDSGGYYLAGLHTYIVGKSYDIGTDLHENMHALMVELNPDFMKGATNPETYYVRKCAEEGIARWGEVTVRVISDDLNFVGKLDSYERDITSDYEQHYRGLQSLIDKEKRSRLLRLKKWWSDGRPTPHFLYVAGYKFAKTKMAQLVESGLTFAQALEMYAKNPPETIDDLIKPEE